MTSLCQEGQFICFQSVDPEANRLIPFTVDINNYFLGFTCSCRIQHKRSHHMWYACRTCDANSPILTVTGPERKVFTFTFPVTNISSFWLLYTCMFCSWSPLWSVPQFSNCQSLTSICFFGTAKLMTWNSTRANLTIWFQKRTKSLAQVCDYFSGGINTAE